MWEQQLISMLEEGNLDAESIADLGIAYAAATDDLSLISSLPFLHSFVTTHQWGCSVSRTRISRKARSYSSDKWAYRIASISKGHYVRRTSESRSKSQLMRGSKSISRAGDKYGSGSITSY